MFKKSLAAVAVLGAFAGSAFAAEVTMYGVIDTGLGSVRISVSGEVIPGAAQRGCPLYLRCSMPDLMR